MYRLVYVDSFYFYIFLFIAAFILFAVEVGQQARTPAAASWDNSKNTKHLMPTN